MKILFINETPHVWQSGIWFHRVNAPAKALMERGHHVRQICLGNQIAEEFMDWPDVVVFGRAYFDGHYPVRVMHEYKKRGKRVLYDMDDDFWEVAKNNPSTATSNALKDQYETMMHAADALITPSEILAKKFKKHFKKPVFICPNGVDFREYTIPQEKDPMTKGQLTIGYMGGSSHWEDIGIIVEPLEKLSEKYDFLFVLYGLVGEPIESTVYSYHKMLEGNLQPERNPYFKAAIDFYSRLERIKMMHVPFRLPELHPMTLSRLNFDIGLAPIVDTEFNRGKSSIKFFEYAATGAVTLASDVGSYKDDVGYRAKNTPKDWYDKLEKLIVDKEFREKLYKEQSDYVRKNFSVGPVADLKNPEVFYPGIGLPWELACQKPSTLKTLNQR